MPQDAGVPGSVWLNLQVFPQCRTQEPEWQSPDRTAKDRTCDEGTAWRKQSRLFPTRVECYWRLSHNVIQPQLAQWRYFLGLLQQCCRSVTRALQRQKKSTNATSHTPLRWAQKMSLLGGVSLNKKSFMQAIFPRLFQDALDDFH